MKYKTYDEELDLYQSNINMARAIWLETIKDKYAFEQWWERFIDYCHTGK